VSSATVPPADRIIRAVASKSSHPTVSTAPRTGAPAAGGSPVRCLIAPLMPGASSGPVVTPK
jgi:hypothetical protein